MSIRIACTLIFLSLAVSSHGDNDKEVSIRSKRGAYEAWIATNRPHLIAVPKSSTLRTDFTTIDYGKGDISPIFDFHYKAGDWDGILNVTIIFAVDTSGAVTGVREERFTFVALPATAPHPSPSDGGRLRHAYHGFNLQIADIPAFLTRVCKGDDFDTEREKAHQEGKIVMSRRVDTDDWRSLRAGVAPKPPEPKGGETPKRRMVIIPPP
jgi:hypothetical protein